MITLIPQHPMSAFYAMPSDNEGEDGTSSAPSAAAAAIINLDGAEDDEESVDLWLDKPIKSVWDTGKFLRHVVDGHKGWTCLYCDVFSGK